MLRCEESMVVSQGKSQGQKGVPSLGHNIAQLVLCHITQGGCFSRVRRSGARADV